MCGLVETEMDSLFAGSGLTYSLRLAATLEFVDRATYRRLAATSYLRCANRSAEVLETQFIHEVLETRSCDGMRLPQR